MRTLFVLIAALVSNPVVNAETLQLDYKTLYSHVKKLDEESMKALRFAFGLENNQTNGALCQVRSATLVTQKQQFDLPVTEEGRFTIWAERALKLAKAKVMLDIAEPAEHCDMSVQLETKPEYNKPHYKLSELREIARQYQAFFDEMGSFLSFLMPGTQGIQLQFDSASNPQKVTLNGQPVSLPAKGDRLQLSDNWLEEHQGELTLPAAPRRIIAWVEDVGD